MTQQVHLPKQEGTWKWSATHILNLGTLKMSDQLSPWLFTVTARDSSTAWQNTRRGSGEKNFCSYHRPKHAHITNLGKKLNKNRKLYSTTGGYSISMSSCQRTSLKTAQPKILCGHLPFHLKILCTFQLSITMVANVILSWGNHIPNNTIPATA
jgi:hypothetical protein